LVEKIVRYLRAGNFREIAAQRVGLDPTTMSKWMHRKGAIYEAFRQAVLDAELDAEILAVGRMMKFGEKDAKALQWWLERRATDRWGRKDKTELSGFVGQRPDLTKLTDDELAAWETLWAKVAP